VDDAFAVRDVEGVGHLDAEIQQGRKLDRPPADPLAQRLPLEQLHHDEMLPGVLADVVDHADVGVGERRGRARLALEALDGARVLRHLERQELERHGTAEAGVLGLVDDAHPSAAELLDDSVVRERLAAHASTSERRACPSRLESQFDARGVGGRLRHRPGRVNVAL